MSIGNDPTPGLGLEVFDVGALNIRVVGVVGVRADVSPLEDFFLSISFFFMMDFSIFSLKWGIFMRSSIFCWI